MQVFASDEALHPPGPAGSWNESFYANFFDAKTGFGGLVRVGLSPNHGLADSGAYLFLPGAGLGVVRYLEAREGHRGPIGAGAIRCDSVEPLRRWRVSASGELFAFADADELRERQAGISDQPRKRFELELLLDGVHEPLDYYPLAKTAWPGDGLRGWLSETRRMPARVAALPDQLARVRRLKDARHYEQACRASGRLVVDGREHAIDGVGFRDHSWGVREWQAFTRYRWLNCCFSEALSFSLVRLQILGFRFTGGFVMEDGRVARVGGWRLDSRGSQIRAEVRTQDGASHVLTGEVERRLPISFGTVGYSTTITTGLTRFRCGERTSYGIAEFLEQTAP